MREFLVYTGLRLALFVAAMSVVGGIWALFSDEVDLLLVILIAAIVSAVGSAYLLRGARERFAARVQERAARASRRFEEMRSKEDAD